MRILFVAPYLPIPQRSGGKVRVFHVLRELAKTEDITLACYVSRESEPFVHEIERWGIKRARLRERCAEDHFLDIFGTFRQELLFLSWTLITECEVWLKDFGRSGITTCCRSSFWPWVMSLKARSSKDAVFSLITTPPPMRTAEHWRFCRSLPRAIGLTGSMPPRSALMNAGC